ncbi:MAG: hypothetical protein ACI9HU_000104, partial [Colwellia sp.]
FLLNKVIAVPLQNVGFSGNLKDFRQGIHCKK